MDAKATRETVALGGSGVWVDSREFSELIARGRWERNARWVGEVLEGLDDKWALKARPGTQRNERGAAVALVRAADGGGRYRLGADVGPPAAAWDPPDEVAECEQMPTLASAGDCSAALRS